LMAIYDFDSDVQEVKKIQGLKFVLDACFDKKNKKYMKKSYEAIEVTPEQLEEYGIENFEKFDSTFKSMVSAVGLNKFILEEPQEENIDNLAWMNNYSLKNNNYVKLYMALIGEDYLNFDLEYEVKEYVCESCHCVRASEQFESAICKKCDIENLIWDGKFHMLKERYIKDIPTYIDDKGYFKMLKESNSKLYEDFCEWRSDGQNVAENEYSYLSQEFYEQDQPDIGWEHYINEMASNDLRNAYEYDFEDYVKEISGYDAFEGEFKIRYLEKKGFKDD